MCVDRIKLKHNDASVYDSPEQRTALSSPTGTRSKCVRGKMTVDPIETEY